jgi:hypothetical protein
MDRQNNNTHIKIYEKAGQYLLASWFMAVGRFSLITWMLCILELSSGQRLGLPYNIAHGFLLFSGSLWVVSILLSFSLTMPLRCTTCGNRVAVITSYAKLSQSYIDREKSESTKNKIFNFFIPLELISKRMHCVRCNQEYSLSETSQ